MKIVTSPLAKRQFRGTVRYIQREFGHRSAEKFVQKVQETRDLLAYNPHLGPIEPLLADTHKEYRSVVVTRLNKIVYHIVGNHIEIVAFWDCRREPKALVNQMQQDNKEI